MTWDYNTTEYQKQAKADPKWHLERLINYGLGEEKIDKETLEKYLKDLNIPDEKRAFLELLIWNRKF